MRLNDPEIKTSSADVSGFYVLSRKKFLKSSASIFLMREENITKLTNTLTHEYIHHIFYKRFKDGSFLNRKLDNFLAYLTFKTVNKNEKDDKIVLNAYEAINFYLFTPQLKIEG